MLVSAADCGPDMSSTAGVQVSFEHGAPRRSGPVVAADGLTRAYAGWPSATTGDEDR
jgi:hypothetical protein